MLMATIGGSNEVGMDQANVIMFALPVLSAQVTKTVCRGCKSRYASSESTSTFVCFDTRFFTFEESPFSRSFIFNIHREEDLCESFHAWFVGDCPGLVLVQLENSDVLAAVAIKFTFLKMDRFFNATRISSSSHFGREKK